MLPEEGAQHDPGHMPTGKKKPGNYPGFTLVALEASNISVIATKLLYFWQNLAMLVGEPSSLGKGPAGNRLLRLLKHRIVPTALTPRYQSINTL